MSKLKVIITSSNPVKINATKNIFNHYFKDQFEFHDLKVPSGVKDQPMTSEETLQGAITRVKNASKEQPDAEYYIGIEGGAEEIENEIMIFAWIVIMNKEGYISKSRTADFTLPSKIAELIKQGKELGDADDIVFGRTNSKQENGSVGILTKDLITRTNYYEHALTLALIPFLNSNLYFNN
jgi:inosine/xanthosine triphosphatase